MHENLIFVSDKSSRGNLVFYGSNVLRTQLFKTIIDEYERLTCTKRSANDIIDCQLARWETFIRISAAARCSCYVFFIEYREREHHAVIDINFKFANFPGASLITRSDSSNLSLDSISPVPFHSNEGIAGTGWKYNRWLGLKHRFYDDYVSTHERNFPTRALQTWMRSSRWRQHLIARSLDLSFRLRPSVESIDNQP